MEERDSKLGKEERLVHKNWFKDQNQDRQAEIIKPAFDKEHRKNEDKREARKKYGTPDKS